MSDAAANEAAIADAREQGHNNGWRMAHSRIMAECMRELDLPMGDPTLKLAQLADERVKAIAALRDLCASFGDNDWDDDLNLYDIIEKHLARHLHTSAE